MPQTIATTNRPAYQAYQILYIAFIVAPALAGLDTFTFARFRACARSAEQEPS